MWILFAFDSIDKKKIIIISSGSTETNIKIVIRWNVMNVFWNTDLINIIPSPHKWNKCLILFQTWRNAHTLPIIQ